MNTNELSLKMNMFLYKLNVNNSNTYICKHMKLAMFLYMTDTKYTHDHSQSTTTQKLHKMFKEYKDFIEDELFYYKHNLHTNSPHDFKKRSDLTPEDIEQFMNDKRITIETIKQMTITELLHDKILKLSREEEIVKNSMLIYNKMNIENSLIEIHNHETALLKTYPITQNISLNELKQNIHHIQILGNKLNDISQKLRTMQHKMENIIIYKKMENKVIIEKNHCKNTLLLNIDKMKNTLNDDTIKHIQSFIDPDFLEKTRKVAVSARYFTNSRKQMKQLLKKWSFAHLQNFCNNHIYLIYNMKNFPEMEVYDDTTLLFNIFNTNYIHNMFKNNTLAKKKKALINKMLMNNDVIQYYDFQKNVYFINKMLSSQNKPQICNEIED